MSAAEPHLDLAHLRALCDAATPGPWRVGWPDGNEPNLLACYGFDGVVVCGRDGVFEEDPQTGAYLAAVSPDVVRALLDRLERAEAAWLYLGDRLLGRDEVSDGELRGLCGGHHVGGPAFCDRCGGVMEGSL